jgi:hypothetical protein
MPSVFGCGFISMCYVNFWLSRLHETWYKTDAVEAYPNIKLYNLLKSETTWQTEICPAGCIINTTVKVTFYGIVTMNMSIRLATSFCVVCTLRLQISVPLASWMCAKCCVCLLCLRFGYNEQSFLTGQWCTYYLTGWSSISVSENVQVVAII